MTKEEKAAYIKKSLGLEADEPLDLVEVVYSLLGEIASIEEQLASVEDKLRRRR